MSNKYQTLEDALETAAYRCDLATFSEFMNKVESVIANDECSESLENEINSHINNARSSVFNINKVANDATTNIEAVA
jgi:hypothetical protein